MGKIGNYEVPDVKFQTILKATETLVETLNGSVSDEKTFIEALGHNSRNGAYLQKVSDMRKYKLLSSRGITATDLAKKIIRPLSQNEKKEAMNKSIESVELWRELFKRIGRKELEEEKFRLQLSEITGDREKAYKQAGNILSLYKDILQYYDDNLTKSTEKYISKEEDKELVGNEDMENQIPQVKEGKILLKFNGSNVLLDKNDTNIGVLINILEGLKEKKKKD